MSKDSEEILKLMLETYATLRALINNPDRELVLISLNWPYLKDADCLLDHSTRLLGKNVKQIWQYSLSNKIKPLRQYLKICSDIKKNEKELTAYLNEYKEAILARRDEIPKIKAVFQLLLLYFGKNSEFFYKLIKQDATHAEMLGAVTSNYPILIIRGSLLYDQNAICALCALIMESSIITYTIDVLEGILILFLHYYIYGFSYPKEIEKTLEFI